MATLTVTTITKNSITLTLTGVNQNTSGQRACSWKIRRHNTTYGEPTWTYLATGETQTSNKYTGLYAGTSYDVQAAYQEISGGSYTTIAKTAIITADPSGTLTISNITETSATVSINSFNPYDSGETEETCYAYLWFGTGSTATTRETSANTVTIASNNIPYSGGSYNKTSLSSGTTYTFEYRIQPSSDATVTWKISKSFTTDAPAVPVITLSPSNITTSSVDLTVQSSNLLRTCYCYFRQNGIRNSSYDCTLTTSSTSATKTITGLSANTSYTFSYTPEYANPKVTGTAVSKTVTTSAPATGTGNIIICGFTTSSITFKIINATAGTWYWRKRSSGGNWPTNPDGDTSVLSSGGSSNTITFSNLSFGNFYDFKASYQTNYGEAIIETINCAPSSGNAVGDFSHQTWNLMVDSIYYYRGTWTPTYADQTNTKISSNPYTLTATKFNSLWENLRQLSSKMGAKTWNSGDTVYAIRFYDPDESSTGYACLNDGLKAMQ